MGKVGENHKMAGSLTKNLNCSTFESLCTCKAFKSHEGLAESHEGLPESHEYHLAVTQLKRSPL